MLSAIVNLVQVKSGAVGIVEVGANRGRIRTYTQRKKKQGKNGRLRLRLRQVS